MWKVCLLASALAACTDLPPVAAGECGNQVVEPAREDCDVLPDPRHGAGLVCERCRYVCDPTAAAPACPPSWACGRDGTCRHGTARFVSASGEPQEFPSATLVAGDRDGDLAMDVTGAARGAIGVLTGVERVLDAELTSISSGDSLATTDLDRDGLADLLRPSFRGVHGRAGVRGGESRPMLAVQTFDLYRTIPGTQSPDPHTKLAAVRTDADLAHRRVFAFIPGTTLSWVRIDTPLAAPAVLLGVASTAVSFLDPVVGNIDVAPTKGGDEVVLSHRGGTAIYVVRMEPTPVVLRTIALTLPLARAPVLGDVDADGDLDIVAPVQDVSGIVVLVALGDGAGVFGAATLQLRYSAATVMPCSQGQSTQVGGAPLAIADIDGNGTADFVTSAGLVIQPTTGSYCTAAPVGSTETVVDAVVLDATGDGIFDAAWITGGPFVRLAIGKGGGLFEQRMINLAGAATTLDAGTFDWDSYDDLLVGEAATDGVTAFEVIKGTNIANTDRVLQGPRVPGFASLAIGPLGERSDSTIDDFVIFGIDDVSKTGYLARIAVLAEGDSFFSELPGPALSAAQFLAAGDIDGTGYRDDVIALFEDPTGATRLRVWSDQSWYLSDRAVRGSTATGIPASTPAQLADLDGDGADELVFAVAGGFKVFDLGDLDRPAETFPGAAADTIVRLPRPGGDCLVTISTLEGASVFCPLGGAPPIGVTTNAALGGATGNLDEDPELELVVVTMSGVVIYDVGTTTASELGAFEVAGLGASPIQTCPADLDGDGVLDLVVGAGASVEVLWGTAHDGGTP